MEVKIEFLRTQTMSFVKGLSMIKQALTILSSPVIIGGFHRIQKPESLCLEQRVDSIEIYVHGALV